MTQHTLTPHEEQIMRLGGLTLDQLFGPTCALPEWTTKLLSGAAYCKDPEGCPYKHVGCASATLASQWAVNEFVAWVDWRLDGQFSRLGVRPKEKVA